MAPRRSPRRLLVLDVEGTIFEPGVRLEGTELASTIWQGLAVALGPAALQEEIETHRRWAAGEYATYIEWMRDTIGIHRRHGLDRATFDATIASALYRPDAVSVISSIDRDAFEPVLITGGFRELASRAQLDLGIRHCFAACEYLFGPSGRLEGYNLLPCDFAGKLDFVQLMLREYGLTERDWVFVGDGANDAAIAAAAPHAVGITPHPALAEVTTAVVAGFAALPAVLDALE